MCTDDGRQTGGASQRGVAVRWASQRIASAALAAVTLLWAAAVSAGHGTGGPVLAIPPEYAKRLLDGGERLSFVDLRPAEEFRKTRLPGAKSVPGFELTRRYQEIPRAGRVILYSTSPFEEVQAAYQFLRDQGYRNVSILGEGFPDWLKRGYPVEK